MRPNFHAALVEKPSYRKKPQYEIRKYIQKDLRRNIIQTIRDLKWSHSLFSSDRITLDGAYTTASKSWKLDINRLFTLMTALNGEFVDITDNYSLG